MKSKLTFQNRWEFLYCIQLGDADCVRYLCLSNSEIYFKIFLMKDITTK